jgi:hypothetical protein
LNKMLSCVIILYRFFVLSAPVAQRIERWPPEPGARVRVPSGAFSAIGKLPQKTKPLTAER